MTFMTAEEKRTIFITFIEKLQPEIFKIGMEEGRQEEKLEIAKAMLKKEIDLETISTVTDLSKAELKKLLS